MRVRRGGFREGFLTPQIKHILNPARSVAWTVATEINMYLWEALFGKSWCREGEFIFW
jgi:hypothetical protein